MVSTMGIPVPYLTLLELKQSPIYTQLRKLVPGSSDAERDAELGRIILRVSAAVNAECNQNLAATVDNEIGTVRISDDGSLRLHARSTPVIEVLSVSVGPDAYSLKPLPDLSHVVLDPWRITIPGGGFGNNLFTGYRPGTRLWAQWSYVNGFPVTSLASTSAAGDSSIVVADATGIVPNQTLLTIEDGRLLERVAPSAVSGNTLTVSPLMYAHQSGTGLSGLPDDIKEAILILISRYHDNWSLSMGAITHDGTGGKKPGKGPAHALCEPATLLRPYRRMW